MLNLPPEPRPAARILIIDDNPAIHEDFRLALCPERRSDALAADDRLMFGEPARPQPPRPEYELDHAMSGREGIEQTRQALAQDRPYQVAFVDIRMPGLDGVATIEGLWQIDSRVQIVICTAYSDYSWEDLTRRLGHTDKLLVLKKPFDDIEVTQSASTLAEKWHLARQAALKLEQMELLVAQRTQKFLEFQRRESQRLQDLALPKPEGAPVAPSPTAAPQPPLTPQAAEPASPDEASGKEGPLLLLVGNDAGLLSSFNRGLGAEYRLLQARDAQQALDQARDAVPDLIVLDMDLARLDGLELCRRLKTDELASHVPVVLLTTRASEQFEINALEAGADDCLAWPLRLPLLKAHLDNLLRARRKLLERFGADTPLQPRELATNPADVYFLRRMTSIVETNLSDYEFDVDALVQQMKMSRRQVFRKLKAIAGCTPNGFIRTMRLQRAAKLLETSEMTITDITYAVGFSDLKYFRSLFREQFGVLPGEYAKRGNARTAR